MLKGDATRLKQILMNLLKMSMKYTVSGFIKVLFAFHSDEQMIEVHVVDNGKGLSQSSQRLHLYRKLRTSTTKFREKDDDSDLGIMISKRLVLANQGTFDVFAKHG